MLEGTLAERVTATVEELREASLMDASESWRYPVDAHRLAMSGLLATQAADLIEELAALRSSGAGAEMRERAYQEARKTADEMHARAERMKADKALCGHACFVDGCGNFVDVLSFTIAALPLDGGRS